MGTFYLFVNLLTLTKFPLPWQDETYNASITTSLLDNGQFIPQVVYYTTGLQNDIRYGPVFFGLTGLSFKLFGIGVFQLRIITLLSGILVIGVIDRILFEANTRKGLRVLCIILICSDPFFIKCMHEGRMDLTALLFVVIGFLYVIKWFNNSKVNYVIILSISFVLGLLTTPRVGFILLALIPLFYFLKNHTVNDVLKLFTVSLLIVFTIYSVWVIYAFEGYSNFFAFYHSFSSGYTQLGGFYSFIQKNQYILIPLASMSVLIGIINLKGNWFNPINIYSISAIICFYLLVKDPGPYSVFIVPFLYILLLSPLNSGLSVQKKKLI